MRKKERLGFICTGHHGRTFFLNKNTGKIVSRNSIKITGVGYLSNKAVVLRKRFPLNQQLREELMNKYNLLTQKI